MVRNNELNFSWLLNISMINILTNNFNSVTEQKEQQSAYFDYLWIFGVLF